MFLDSDGNRRFRQRRPDSILGTFYHDSLPAKIVKALLTSFILKAFGSQIENKDSLKVEKAI